jgi:transposase
LVSSWPARCGPSGAQTINRDVADRTQIQFLPHRPGLARSGWISWRTAMNQPDSRTIAEFRRRHLKALSDLFIQVLKLCQAAGLVKLGHVALDGSKMAANASVHKAMS